MSRDRLVEKQMEIPTLEQVKGYFKDASEVIETFTGNTCSVNPDEIELYKGNYWYMLTKVWCSINGYAEIVEYKPKLTKDVPNVLTKYALRGITEPKHYNNTNGSLYKFCEDKELNSYEFDIIKRVMRCRKKRSVFRRLAEN